MKYLVIFDGTTNLVINREDLKSYLDDNCEIIGEFDNEDEAFEFGELLNVEI